MNDLTPYARLRTLFRAAVSIAVAQGGAGCARRISPDDFSANVCRAGVHRPVEGATPATPVDYLALRTEMDTFPGQPPPTQPPVTVASVGTPCSGATNRAACMAALEALRSGAGWVPTRYGNDVPEHRYVVFTRGDAVTPVVTVDELARLLAPIDSAEEAAWIASERGYRILCDGANARRTASGFELRAQTGHTCGRGTGIDEHVVAVSAAGQLTVVETVRVEDGNPNCVIGRRPEGMDLGSDVPARTLGEYLARAAELEAASVHAFERLARELRAHGAPERLARSAERSARDEVRHAAVTARLARRYGGEPRALPAAPLPVRDPYAVALENAVEGCVRETFGALQATWQAGRAADPEIARAMRAIARDETRHAALAWEVGRWVDGLLTEAERGSVAAAKREAVATLRRELGASVPPDVASLAGVPGAREGRRLHDAVRGELWGA